MPHDLILGTAGHIDHGKTSLVKALTGIDCDRLPEEKARGITVDIGFASLVLGNRTLGIVDVPGHERFVKNMLAGATGIDLAMLVVAADDSVMPQTREHLAILKLLGIRRGVIALTKSDLVDGVTREVVELEIRELVKGSFLEAAKIVPVSSRTGQGIDDLKSALLAVLESESDREEFDSFRLAIDRSFVVQGHGTVVTGSVASGSVRIGDAIEWHKGDGTSEIVRVRGLNHHGTVVEALRRGQRAAINLAGVPHEFVHRGQELAAPGSLSPSRVLTVRVTALAEANRPLKHRLPVRLHIGTAEVMATLSLLDADRVLPDRWALAQLSLDRPATSVWGQPFVLRDSSAEMTIGGGQVLQPTAKKLRRRHLESIVRVEQLWNEDPAARVAAAAWLAGLEGASSAELMVSAGISGAPSNELIGQLAARGTLAVLKLSVNQHVYLQAERVTELDGQILAALGALHADNPLATAHDRVRLIAHLSYLAKEAVLQAAVDRLLREKKLVGDAKRIARADFKPKLSTNQRKLKDKIVEAIREGGFQPPEPAAFANQAGGNASSLTEIFEVACAEGLLVRVTSELYLAAETEAAMRERVRELLRRSSGATVGEIRDLLGTTRKYAVPLCEYLDRVKLTKRMGDVRMLAEPIERASAPDRS